MAAKQPIKKVDKEPKHSAIVLAKKLKARKAFRKKLLSQI